MTSSLTARRIRLAALALATSMYAGLAVSGAVITFGNTSLGVNDTGELNFFGDGPGGSFTYGVYRSGVGDAISPGCLCEGWGLAIDNTSAVWLNQAAGSGGIGSGNFFGSTGNTATSLVNMADLAVSVRHAYGPSLVADVFMAQVTISNNTGGTLNNVVYRRAMDWDVPPTEFNEYVTHGGVTANLVSNGGNVLYASNNGFATSDPRVGADSIWAGGVDTVNTNFNKAGPADHGSVFDFSFGSLGAGQSRIFNIYYGSAANEAEARSKVAALNANVFSLGQPSAGGGGGGDGEGPPIGETLTLAATAAVGGDPASSAVEDAPTFIFAFGGVGGAEVGASQENPVLPFVPAPGTFSFDAPVSQRWYDPPFTTGFEISVASGSITKIKAPMGFSDLVIYDADGTTVLDSDFDADEEFTFASGTTKFYIRGMLVDTADAAPFPLWMEFAGTPSGMTWTAELVSAPVPEPESYAMLLAGLGVLGFLRRRQQARA